jgi:RNA polymerase sigma-70 factor, ECF subfamily
LDSEEGRLLVRAQQGDLIAFESLVQMHQQRVFAHCYRLLNNTAEAEDLCSETFLRAYQHLGSLRADPSIVHWLLRVAGNLAISSLRKRNTRPTIELDEAREVASTRPSPEDEVIMQSRRDIVRQCLHKLSPAERTAVLMFYLDEKPLEDIARALGTGLAGAKSRVHRARHRLKALVKQELGEDVALTMMEGGAGS